ncbi:MAG TPA: 4-hydroxy-tetrahydrodipicolinate synthase [Pyrinomonadaceae bacterium]|nr:4-hydroxy-tetrahydrodipicolinate synthase [Chloracidobacterium sp.]MBP9934845.1 4-hydroxy-tetrahydrodipicolinate synthase [Pyrinomonadaceae bacterium]MBK7803271.1 4-hydroxy-tetrahydrodipicolinate synthase [Chloracidobacterium sp.]MBK9439737.1 4-hydroxy-tetrahydrodipicolinate synthase [Chloracidobacterium sp.]MBK9768796.1 4-hydroxy-tetrahydrodipicolinate synthase [Chloracidobacterium sp.]
MTMRIEWMSGCATALVTPFHKDGSIDDDCFRKLVERQVKGGVKILVPCGTTGESVTMDEHERLHVIKMTVEVAKRIDAHVVAGTGSNSTAATIDFTRKAREAGADAALIVAPYYNKPTQEGIFAHYSEIAKSVMGFPIMLYNVPSRTASNISADTTLRLANTFNNIVATKEASGNYSQVMEIIANRPKYFRVFSGDDASTLPLISLGADGLVSVCANEIPKETAKMVEHALNGSFHFARKINYKILPLMEANFIESSPAPCKFVMKEMGLCEENLRLPLVRVTAETRGLLKGILKDLKLG